MTEARFTWFPKLTATAAKVPEAQRGALLWALALYGTAGEEPSLEWPLDAIFESLREDIDNSKRAIDAGKTGGRGRRKGSSESGKDHFTECETPLSEIENPPFDDCAGDETGLSETVNGGLESAEPKPYQSIPNHTKPKKERARFTPPTVDEVRAYCEEKGYTDVDPVRFVAFYESVGWVVGKARKPMRSWKAAVTSTWHKPGKEEDDDEYSRL